MSEMLRKVKIHSFLKRLFDIVAGTVIFVTSLPLLVVIAVLIKLDSRGPVLFKQKRLGQYCRVFSCYKFRTMKWNAEDELGRLLQQRPDLKQQWNTNFKLEQDPRITRIGRFLRKTSLDELPQLINVIRGEMSLLGPCPRPLYELESVRDGDMSLFLTGLLVRPGITGLWQVSGRSEIDFHQRILLDALYVRKWSLWLDIWILVKTVYVVCKQIGAR